jgi:methylenetetrahydrofolate dehydrogenase (NADP+)/methenyltetrahydrofolate cyclohydrolase
MVASVIDGRAVAQELRAGLAPRINALGARGIQPGLAVIIVGENIASEAYVRNKARACAEAGVRSEVRRLPGGATEAEVLALVEQFNRDPRIHGIIVQLPLPEGLSPVRILQSVAVDKDVDGFNWSNLGALTDGHPGFVPCTPLAVVALLDAAKVAIESREAVVVGRSSIVGKPLALLLLARNATVTVCHSRTRDLGAVTSRADILIAAVGKPGVITDGMVRPGAAVIDVGINRLPDGRLAGDVDYEKVREKAGWITPVPGGVGPMTVAMLIANTVAAAERSRPGTARRSSRRSRLQSRSAIRR